MKNIFRIVGIVISLLLSSILAACHNDNIIYEGPFPLDKDGLPLSDSLLINYEVYKIGEDKEVMIVVDDLKMKDIVISLAEDSSIMHWVYEGSKDLADYKEVPALKNNYSNGGSSIIQEFYFKDVSQSDFSLAFSYVGKDGLKRDDFERHLVIEFSY